MYFPFPFLCHLHVLFLVYYICQSSIQLYMALPICCHEHIWQIARNYNTTRNLSSFSLLTSHVFSFLVLSHLVSYFQHVLISPGCPWPSIALQVQNLNLKHHSFIHFDMLCLCLKPCSYFWCDFWIPRLSVFGDWACIWGMFHHRIHLISPICPQSNSVISLSHSALALYIIHSFSSSYCYSFGNVFTFFYISVISISYAPTHLMNCAIITPMQLTILFYIFEASCSIGVAI